METLSVFCYGEVGVDNIIQADQLPSPEIAVFPQAESYHIGGAAANTAVWLARMGVPVGLSGNRIGDDLLGGLRSGAIVGLQIRSGIPRELGGALIALLLIFTALHKFYRANGKGRRRDIPG